MDFRHPYLATGIGSFPHEGEREAFRIIFETFPEIPFWPQLPKRSFKEGMVVQYSEGFPSLKWNEKEQRAWVDTSAGFEREVDRFYQALDDGNLKPFEITEDFAKGLLALSDLASWANLKEITYVKGQVTGPVSFGLSLTDPEGKPVFYDPTLREILVRHLSSKAHWMEKRFHEQFPGVPTILFFDEPSLSSFGSAFSGLNREDVVLSLNECFHGVKGLKGVNCCGNTDWIVILSTNLDILSFDAYGYLEPLSLYPKELKAFLEKGGVLAWGIVPTSEDILKEDALSLIERFEKGIRVLSKK